jgi:uncharacterized protein YkwD
MGVNRRALVGLAFAGVVQAARRTEDARSVEERVFLAVNRERRSRNLPVLSWSNALAAEARRHSREMERRGFFGHTDPERGTLINRLRSANIEYDACAENLYKQSRSTGASSAAVAAWLRSRGHRTNLLSRIYRETGVGVTVNSKGRYIVTQIFLA